MPRTVIQTQTRHNTTHVPNAIYKNGYQHQHQHQHKTRTRCHLQERISTPTPTQHTYPLPSARATVAYSGSLSGSTTNPGRTTNDAVTDTASSGFAGGKDLVMEKSGEEKGVGIWGREDTLTLHTLTHTLTLTTKVPQARWCFPQT